MPSTVAVSAPGKVLLAGGYLVLDRKHTGLVLALSARINVIAGGYEGAAGEQQSRPSRQSDVVVESPQFLGAVWRYGCEMAGEGGGVKVRQGGDTPPRHKNAFVETTLTYALTYIAHLQTRQRPSSSSPPPPPSSSRLVILADNDYYSRGTPTADTAGRFSKFAVPLAGAHKTGLGSSAALVTALTGALLSYHIPRDVLDMATPSGRRTLHNLAQAAHCAAQGKVGSGFDVAAAVYGSCLYRRFSPSVLGRVPEAETPGFSEELVALVDGPTWDTEMRTDAVGLPPGVSLRMCDVDCGSQTVGMVNKVLGWRAADGPAADKLWADLQEGNDRLAACLRGDGPVADLPRAVAEVRALVREMGRRSGVPIEPPPQTDLLDAITEVEGVYGGVVPGAGGFDALALLMRDDEETRGRVEERIGRWTGAGVRLLGVGGEAEGVRREDLACYEGWV